MGVEPSQLLESDQEERYDHFDSFIHSKQLLEQEDEGMVQLLMLKDVIDDLLKCHTDVSLSGKGDREPYVIQSIEVSIDNVNLSNVIQILTEANADTQVQSLPSPSSVSTSPSGEITVADLASLKPTPLNTTETLNTDLLKILGAYEELSKQLMQCIPANARQSQTHKPPSSAMSRQPGSNKPGEFASQSPHEGVLSLRDLVFLPRREFKLQGGQVGDQSSDISYNNICKQMDDGRREEIVRGVLKIVRLGFFKDMLINNDGISVSELKGFL